MQRLEELQFGHPWYIIVDNVIGGLTVCFSAAKQISDTFSFLWNQQMVSDEDLKLKALKTT